MPSRSSTRPQLPTLASVSSASGPRASVPTLWTEGTLPIGQVIARALPAAPLATATVRPTASGSTSATALALLLLWVAGWTPSAHGAATTATSATAAAAPSLAKTPSPTPPTAAPGGRTYNLVDSGARSPEEQRRGFTVPEGFEVELVAAERIASTLVREALHLDAAAVKDRFGFAA